MDAETEANFFDTVVDTTNTNENNVNDVNNMTFTQLNLSRPLLRAIEISGTYIKCIYVLYIYVCVN
jgi:hypothetical protein